MFQSLVGPNQQGKACISLNFHMDMKEPCISTRNALEFPKIPSFVASKKTSTSRSVILEILMTLLHFCLGLVGLFGSNKKR